MQITITTDAHGEPEAHRTGCQHLKRSAYRRDPYDLGEVATRDDVTFEVWGASGVASDECSAPWDSPEYRAFTLERYDGLVGFAPCTKALGK